MFKGVLPGGFVAPCLPTKAAEPPSGGLWLHEIKHDGFRVIARKANNDVRLYSWPGNDLTERFPLIVQALASLRSRSCVIDGEAVACGQDGVSSFDRLRYRRDDANVFLYAFDLIELDGDDLRCEPLQVRKATLASWPRPAAAFASTITFNMTTRRSSFGTPAGWGWRGSCRSGRTRPTVPVAHPIGSR